MEISFSDSGEWALIAKGSKAIYTIPEYIKDNVSVA